MERRPQEYDSISGTLEAVQLAINSGHFLEFGGIMYVNDSAPPKRDPVIYQIAQNLIEKVNNLLPDFAIKMPNILKVQEGGFAYSYDRLTHSFLLRQDRFNRASVFEIEASLAHEVGEALYYEAVMRKKQDNLVSSFPVLKENRELFADEIAVLLTEPELQKKIFKEEIRRCKRHIGEEIRRSIVSNSGLAPETTLKEIREMGTNINIKELIDKTFKQDEQQRKQEHGYPTYTERIAHIDSIKSR